MLGAQVAKIYLILITLWAWSLVRAGSKIMKKIFLIVSMVLFASTAWAAPFLVCDPQSGVTHYKVTGPAWVVSPVIAQPDGSVKMDVAESMVGVNALSVAACISDAIWGERCSITIPFSFTRPAPPVTTSNIRLLP